MSVVIDASLAAPLRAMAVHTDQTLGAVSLRAIEAHVDELANCWPSPERLSRPARLFSVPKPVHRRHEVGVATQLRMAASDQQALDELVERWGAPSRTALINEALVLYLPRADNATA